MRRRVLLAGLSAGLAAVAGCSGTADSDDGTPTDRPADDPTPTNDRTPTDQPDSPTDTPTEEPGEGDWDLGAASIVDLETANRTYALAPLRYRDDGGSVRLRFTSTATDDGPATVEATLTNENPFENTFGLDWMPPFGRRYSDIPSPMVGGRGEYTYRVGLAFAPTENHELVDEGATFERDSAGYWRLGRNVPDLPETVRLDPGETVRGEYALVGRGDGEGRGRPPGVYEFSRAGERPVRVTVWETGAPGSASESRFAGASVPALPGGRTPAWFHDADADTPTFVHPGVERTELPARVEFTFVNRSRESTSCGHWQLYKLQDGEWFSLGPYVQTADCRVVRPGGTKRWVMRAATGEMAPCQARSFPFLGGGRYAAVAGYGHATSHSSALVSFDAPPVSVVPTDDVASDREGGTVTATGERWETAPDAEHRSRVQLVLERTAGEGDEPERTFIAEQVMRQRFRGLQNTLAFDGSDVDRVVLRTDDRTADRAIGYDGGSLPFRYDGRTYLLTKSSQ
jgi:hypothetical protein